MPSNPVIRSYLVDAGAELETVRRLASPPTIRQATYHLQQAAEKIVKAVRLHHSLPATKDHDIDELVEEIPDIFPLKSRLSALDRYSIYATTFRYPTPTGHLKPGLNPDEFYASIQELVDLLQEVSVAIG